MEKHFEKINEWKNIGIIYHSTEIDNFLDIIISDTLEARKNPIYPYIRGRELPPMVWFSRSKEFGDNWFKQGNISNIRVTFVIDGSKMSNRYNIDPIVQLDYFDDLKKYGLSMSQLSELDEQAYIVEYKYITNFVTNYVQSIEIYFNKKSNNYYSLVDFFKEIDKNGKHKDKLITQLSKMYNIQDDDDFETTVELVLEDILSVSKNLTFDFKKILSLYNNVCNLKIKHQNIEKIIIKT